MALVRIPHHRCSSYRPSIFDLHTEPSVSPPEFSIICHTHGGPATNVNWVLVSQNNISKEESQVIVDTSHNSVYRNELRVRGRYSGRYTCIISNNMQYYFPLVIAHLQATIDISGMKTKISCASQQ